MSDIILKSYKEISQELSQDSSSKHLLLCNGFNCSLGVYTTYKAIFERMEKSYSGYKRLNIERDNIDIEHIIGSLKEQIKNDGLNKDFLDDYINNKVKFDFMTSAYSIVKDNIRNIYQEKSDGIGLLFKNFTNFFTLNYDPLLYLLLMKYKDNSTYITFNNTGHFKQYDIETCFPDDFKRAKDIYDNYKKNLVNTNSNKVESSIPLNKLSKSKLVSEIKEAFDNEKRKFRMEFVDILLCKNEPIQILSSDGFEGEKYIVPPDELFPDEDTNTSLNNISQNVFFLHGAFHIYKDRTEIKKITKKTDKAFYDRLEEILDNPKEEIVCVFTNDNKEKQIKENKYLSSCLNKLNELDGSILIMGSSLDENDSHIFSRINNSKIRKIYNDVHFCQNSLDTNDKNRIVLQRYNRLKTLFPNKEIVLFESNTISYEINEIE